MKKIAITALAALVFAACSDQKPTFTVEGTIDGVKDTTIYLYNNALSGAVKVDSAKIGEDGTFTLKEIQGDGCLTAQIRMELCRQIEQGIDPLGGKSIEECLAALPVEKVPVFRKKIKI
jgi:hypothetical protein